MWTKGSDIQKIVNKKIRHRPNEKYTKINVQPMQVKHSKTNDPVNKLVF